jgi:predicted RNase H-like HicB family nuclease
MNNLGYAVVLERTSSGWSAYVPDLDGCVAAAGTIDDTRQLIHEAIAFHLRGMREDGDPIPEPASVVEYAPLAS